LNKENSVTYWQLKAQLLCTPALRYRVNEQENKGWIRMVKWPQCDQVELPSGTRHPSRYGTNLRTLIMGIEALGVMHRAWRSHKRTPAVLRWGRWGKGSPELQTL